MYPPIQQLAAASSAVVGLLGNPLRFTPFGEADQTSKKPYAVWQTVYGAPENKLADVPDDDSWGVQVDAYSKLPEESRAIAQALRDAFEQHGYIVSWNGEGREEDTKLWRFSFTIEFMTAR